VIATRDADSLTHAKCGVLRHDDPPLAIVTSVYAIDHNLVPVEASPDQVTFQSCRIPGVDGPEVVNANDFHSQMIANLLGDHSGTLAPPRADAPN
jgi:hypothetical protein